MERHGFAVRARLRTSGVLLLGVVGGMVLGMGLLRAEPAGTPAVGSAAERLSLLIRQARPGLAELRWDEDLAAAARLYALDLRGRGELDHMGVAGDRAIDRVRRQGCSDARVGEALGAGSDPGAVLQAWLASPSHRRVILGGEWTHLGVGAAETEGTVVYVAVLAARLVEGLSLSMEGPRVLSGRFASSRASSPFLLVDLERLPAAIWRPETGEFAFAFDPAWLDGSYVRLGFVTAAGELVVTNVLHPLTRFTPTGD